MPNFSTRSGGIEIMDNLDCAGPVVDQTLRELEIINRLLGGNAITVDGVTELLRGRNISEVSVMDLGCGGGDILMLLYKILKSKSIDLNGIGIDANPNIITYAKYHAKEFSTISFNAVNIFDEEFSRLNCDVALATLFFHHLSKEQLIEVLTKLKSQCKFGIVINDLHRHPLAYYSIKLLTKLFSKSSMVKYDAPLSVLRGFTRKEWIEILDAAGIKNYSLKWRWAFRWQIVIRTEN